MKTSYSSNISDHGKTIKLNFGGSPQAEFQFSCPKMLELSYSMLATFQQCPRRYRYRYLEKRKDTIKTFYLAVGSCVHSALARFFTIRNPEERTLQKMLSLVDELWSKEGFRDEAEEQEWLKRTKAMLENFYKIFDCSLMPMAVELPFKAHVENLILKGRVDRIDKLADGKYRIVDYKVGDEEGISTEGTEKDLQPAFYYWGVKEGLKIEISCITYIYLQAGMAKDISISYAEMKEDLTIIKKLAERIDQETAFLPRQNIFCQDCSFQKVCNTQ